MPKANITIEIDYDYIPSQKAGLYQEGFGESVEFDEEGVLLDISRQIIEIHSGKKEVDYD